MTFLNIKDTRLSSWLEKYNAKEKKAVKEANKLIAAQAKAMKKKNFSPSKKSSQRISHFPKT